MLSGMLLAASDIHAAAVLAKPGSLVKFRTDSRVYVVKDASGALEWIKTEADFKQRGFNYSQLMTLSDGQFPLYSIVESQAATVPQESQAVPNHQGDAENVTPMVMVKEGDQIITNINADTPWSAASITKLMTALVLSDMNINWDAGVTMAKGDEKGGARLRVPVGSRFSRSDLLHASLMGSANNATYTLARTSGISMSQFIGRMNAKARELGMINSRFTDPTGLNENNVSTAEDIALLIEAANKVPFISLIGNKTSHEMINLSTGKVHRIGTTNALLKAGDPVGLGKTGYLIESRYNFTVLA